MEQPQKEKTRSVSDDGLQRKCGICHNGFLPCGRQRVCAGVHLTAPQQFVTWKCKDRTDYYWGHYFSSLFEAQKDFVSRAQEEVQYLEQRGIDPTRWSWNPPIPLGEKSRPATPFAPALIPSAPQAMAGLWSAGSLQTRRFRKEARACGFMERGYLCFEEDCAAPVALRELMDRGLYQAPVNEYFAPGEYEGCD